MLFVEWVDLGAQWDNIPGEDDLPGYDADESARLAAQAQAELARPIADPQQAFTVRCQECHDNSTLNKLNAYTDAEIPGLVQRMSDKKKGWIFPEEIARIAQFILDR
jgi:hypothetical protein